MRSLILLTAAAFIVTGCQSSSIADRKRPDELAVGRQAPLVIPPDFNLAPPRPGAPRPIESDSQQQALEALFGPGVRLPARSAIENRLLSDSGANHSDSAIRNTVEQVNPGGSATVVDKGEFLREVLDAPAGDRDSGTATITVPTGTATEPQ
jgi:hypothetical protein